MLPAQMFARLPARATFVADTKNVCDFVQKHSASATNVSQFTQPKKHHGQQCVQNIVSSFTRALMLLQLLLLLPLLLLFLSVVAVDVVAANVDVVAAVDVAVVPRVENTLINLLSLCACLYCDRNSTKDLQLCPR